MDAPLTMRDVPEANAYEQFWDSVESDVPAGGEVDEDAGDAYDQFWRQTDA